MRQVEDIAFAIVVVAQNGAEGEEEKRHSHENASSWAYLKAESLLRQLDAVERAVERCPATEDDESRARADKQCVGEDT